MRTPRTRLMTRGLSIAPTVVALFSIAFSPGASPKSVLTAASFT
jgi:hypothetical protein